MLFQGKLLSLKNVGPNYKVGPKEGTWEKRSKARAQIQLQWSITEEGAVDYSGTPGGLQ